MHDTCHQLTFRVVVGYALTVDDALCRCRQVGPNGIERIFNFADFIEADGRSGISFYATGTLAFLVVAAESLSQYVGR